MLSWRASAEEPMGNSLDFVPANVSFYSSSLQLQKQYEAITASSTYKKFIAVPGVQMALGFWNMRYAIPDSPFAKWDRWVAVPENRQLAALGVDCLRDEVFFVGDEAWPMVLQLLTQAQNIVRVGQIAAALDQGANHAEGAAPAGQEYITAAARLLLNQQMENRQKLVIPSLLVGCKLRDISAVAPQLDRLEELTRHILAQFAIPQDCLSWQPVENSKFLTLNVNLASLAGEEIRTNIRSGIEQFRSRIERVPGEYQPLIDHFSSMNLVVSVGLRDKYLLATVGGSSGLIASLGQGDLLRQRREMEKIRPFQPRPVTAISFVSPEFVAEATSNRTAFQTFATALPEVFKELKLDDQLKQRVLTDLEKFFKEAESQMPATGANVGVSFLTEKGSESYVYDWSAYPHIQSAKPLDILKHVGEHPLFLAAWRSQNNPAEYDFIIRWSKVAYGYFEELAVPKMSEHDRAEYTRWRGIVLPLLSRVDETLRKKIQPALADGQACFVLGTSSAATSWQREMPPANEALPLVEPAFVLAVSDEKLLREGAQELLAVGKDIYDRILTETHANGIPEAILDVSEVSLANAKGVQISKDYLQTVLGLNEKLAPTVVVTKDVAVLTLSAGNAERLLEATSVPVGGAIEKETQPLGLAARWDWSVLLKAVDPWVTYAGDIAAKTDNDNPQAKYTVSQVKAALEALRGLGTMTMTGYQDNATWVYHNIWESRE
jgi:hypothetical protein